MLSLDRVSRLLASMRRVFEVSGRRRLRLKPVIAELLENRQLLAASGLQVQHRSGQSFVTWQEDPGVTGEAISKLFYNLYQTLLMLLVGSCVNNNLCQSLPKLSKGSLV